MVERLNWASSLQVTVQTITLACGTYGRLPTKTVVWVANRDQPLSDPSSSTLQLFVGLTYSALSLNFFGQKERNAFLALYLDTETRRAIVGSWLLVVELEQI